MANVQDIRSIEAGIVQRIVALARDIQDAYQRRRVFNETLRELSALSGRELADLGIHRSMITRVAREAAYGK